MTSPVTYENIRSAVVTEITTEWTATGVNVEYPNREPDFTVDNNTTWARLAFEYGNSVEISQGANPISRNLGFVIFSIFAPLNTGLKAVYALVDTAINIFNRQTIGELEFRTARIRETRNEEPFFVVEIIAPFWFFTCQQTL